MKFVFIVFVVFAFWIYCRYMISMMAQYHKPVALKFFEERNIQIDIMSRRIIARFMDIHELSSLKRLFTVLENIGIKNISSICNESENSLKVTCRAGILILNLRTSNDYKRIVVTRKFGEIYEQSSYFVDNDEFKIMSIIIKTKDMKVTASYQFAEEGYRIVLIPRLYKKTVYRAKGFDGSEILRDFLSFEDADILYPILCGKLSNLPQAKKYSPDKLAKA